MRRLMTIVAAVIVFIVAFYIYTRNLYEPIMKRATGKRTVASVIQDIEPDAFERLKAVLNAAGYKDSYPDKIMMYAFKEERILQVYAINGSSSKLLKEYPFTAYSGALGPKLKEGDQQIPEGIYLVEYLNPNSAYHLSIKVNYPNEYDKSKTDFSTIKDMGGDIFIHGKASTVGCIPIGDQAIEEVFLLTEKAMGNPIKIVISPRDFRANPNYPSIDNISWTEELYDMITAELVNGGHSD